MSTARIRYFTDPGCPPDPERLRLRWQYGDQIRWELRMIGLREHRRDRSDATIHACRAVVGTRLRWTDREEAMLRHLQVLAQAGEMLDNSDTLEIAAERAGLPVAELAAFCAEPEVEASLRAEMRAAAGRPCGTQEVAGDVADLARRAQPATAAEVLEWAGVPLTAAEIAAVCGRDVQAELARTARSGASRLLDPLALLVRIDVDVVDHPGAAEPDGAEAEADLAVEQVADHELRGSRRPAVALQQPEHGPDRKPRARRRARPRP